MSRRKPKLLLWLFLTILVGIILASRDTEPLGKVRMADGTELWIQGVTQGTDHRLCRGPRFRRS